MAPRYLLFRENPCGDLRACGVHPITRQDDIEQARELRTSRVVEPGVRFHLQEIDPTALDN